MSDEKKYLIYVKKFNEKILKSAKDLNLEHEELEKNFNILNNIYSSITTNINEKYIDIDPYGEEDWEDDNIDIKLVEKIAKYADDYTKENLKELKTIIIDL